MSAPRVALPGSSREPRAGEIWLGPADPNQQLTVTVYIRRPSTEEPAPGASREEALAALTANAHDLETVRSFAAEHGLKITGENPAARTVQLSGTVQEFDAAFGIELGIARDEAGNSFLTYRGEIKVPPDLARVAIAILGLDQARVARHHGTST